MSASDQSVVNVRVPTIDDDRLSQLMRTMRPVIQKDGQLIWIRPAEPRGIAFNWEPEFCGRALDITPFRTYETLHSCAFHGFFKPTIAECLAYVTNADIVAGVCAFKCEIASHESWREVTVQAENWMYHRAVLTLYAPSR
jgi:hypothetical protein